MSLKQTSSSKRGSIPAGSSISHDLEGDRLQPHNTTMANNHEDPTPEKRSSTPKMDRTRRLTLTQFDLEPTAPPTPEQTPSRDAKRKFGTAFTQSSTCKCVTKCVCRALISPAKTPSKRPFHTPSFSILHRDTPAVSDLVSAIELKRAAEAVLAQVSWDEVSWDVASNRPGAYYRMVMSKILQEKVDEIAELRAALDG